MKKLIAIIAALLPCLVLPDQTKAQSQPQNQQDLDLQYATELLQPGTPAPDFTLQDINGNPVTLSSFRGRKVVLVFWASWCPDCRAEVPDLKALAAKANPEQVAFVSISFDKTEEALQRYVAENYLPGVQLYDPAGKKDSQVAAAFHVKWIPSLYVLDAQGKVELSTVMIEKVAAQLQQNKTRKPAQRQLCTDENCAL